MSKQSILSKRKLAHIVKAKADFLSQAQFMMSCTIRRTLESVKSMEDEAAKMPTRGWKQRDAQSKHLRDAAALEEQLAHRLGNACISTYKFVQEHKALLPVKLKAELFGEKGRQS